MEKTLDPSSEEWLTKLWQYASIYKITLHLSGESNKESTFNWKPFLAYKLHMQFYHSPNLVSRGHASTCYRMYSPGNCIIYHL